MGIMTRFKDIMAANFNALLEKVEDPEKMIDQYLRNLEDDLGEVKKETASVMADEKSAKPPAHYLRRCPPSGRVSPLP